MAEVGAGDPEGVKHGVGLPGVELAGGESMYDHGDSLLDGTGVMQGMEHIGAMAGAGAGNGAAGAAKLLVEVAERAGSESGRVAASAI